MSKTMGCNGIRVDDRCATVRNHGPYPALRVEEGEPERSARQTVEFLDGRLILREITTKRRRPDLDYMLLGK
jgi:hypothetical protein